MIKKERYVATVLDADSAPDKRNTTSYYDGFNIELINNGRNLSLSPTKVKGLFASTVLGTIVGDVVIDSVLYIFDHKVTGPNFDSIYKVTKAGVVTKITSSDFGFTDSTELDIVGNKENENIIKLYWADGVSQLRVLNVVSVIPDGVVADLILPVSLDTPTTSIIQGGTLIAGKVQYAYTVFNLHGVESVISNLSIPLSVSNNNKGGESSKVMSLSAEVVLDNLDTSFDYVRVYSIHYPEENQLPKISLIYETAIDGSSLTIVDDGNLFISELSVEQFTFLGGVVVIPATIAAKDNRLFAGNYKTTNFDVPFSTLVDSRVYGMGVVIVTPPAEAWSQNNQVNYLLSAVSIRHVTVNYPNEDWTNELNALQAPVTVIHNNIINSPETYTDVHSDTAYTNKLYDSAIGSNLGLAVILVTALIVETVGTVTEDGSTETGAEFGAIGWYRVSWQFDITRTVAGSETITPIIRLHTLDGAVEDTLLLATNGGGGVPYSTDKSFSGTFDFDIASTFDGLRVTVVSDSDEWTVAGVMSTMYRYSTIYQLHDVLINDPIDAGVWENYDINAIDFDGTSVMDIDGTDCTPDSISFSPSTKLATFTFNAAVGAVPLGFTYGGDIDINTDGDRTHINDSTVVSATVDLTSLPSGYTVYVVEAASTPGGATATFPVETPSGPFTINSSSFVVGTEVLTLELGTMLIVNAPPSGVLANGVQMSSLLSNGNKTPISDVHIYADKTLSPPSFGGYQAVTITAASASGVANFPSDAVPTYSYTIIGSSFVDGTDVITLDLGIHILIGAIPDSYTDTSQVDLFSWSGMRTPDDISSPSLIVHDKSGTPLDVSSGVPPYIPIYADIPETHDAINPDYSVYYLQEDLVTIGYEGPNFKLEFNTVASNQGLKQGEIYRIGIVYYNQYKQRSPVKWMVDAKIPYYTPANGIGLTCTFKGTSQDFKNLGVVNYQLVIVKREPKDRTVSSPGFIVPGARYIWSDSAEDASGYVQPYYTLKRFISAAFGGSIYTDYTDTEDFMAPSGPIICAEPVKQEDIWFFFSSDTMFEPDNLYPADSINILGVASINPASLSFGDTKQASIVDGGIDDSAVYVDPTFAIPNIIYTGFLSAVYPLHLLANARVVSPTDIRNFEIDLYHKYGIHVAAREPSTVTLKVPSVNVKEGESEEIDGTLVSNNIDIKDMIDRDSVTDQNASYNHVFPNSVALKFSDNVWHQGGDNLDYSKFISNPPTSEFGSIPIVELLRTVINQYGGNTYEDKQRNTYLLNGEIVSIDSVSPIINTIGDISIGQLNITRADGLDSKSQGYWNINEYIRINNLEHNVDMNSRYDNMHTWDLGLNVTTAYSTYRIADNHKLLSAYNQQNTLIAALPIPATFETVETFSNSIIASKQKFPNEVIDSWTDFLVNDTIDLSGTFGPIVKLYYYKNEIIAFQHRAVAALMINPRVQLQSDDNIGVELGTGTVLYNYTYLVEKSGTRFPWSIIDDDQAIYYYDDVLNAIHLHTGESLSIIKNVQNLLEPYIAAPVTTIKAVYDRTKKEVVFSFNNLTLVYNKLLGGFTRRETVHVDIIGFEGSLLSIVNSSGLKLHKHYAGATYNIMSITYMFAPMPTFDKVFHNLEYRKIGTENFSDILVLDSEGRSGAEDPVTIANKFNINRIHLPRISGTRERFRDVNILVTLGRGANAEVLFIDDMVIMYNIKG